MRDLLARQPGNARRYVEGSKTTIAAYAPVGTLGWGVIVERDAHEAFAPARRMRFLTIGWTLVATALAMLLAVLFARRLTGALGRLADVARELGKGKLEHRVEVRGPRRGGGAGAHAERHGHASCSRRARRSCAGTRSSSSASRSAPAS